MQVLDIAFATLGPEGSNHDLVLRDYLARQGIDASVHLFASFQKALTACADRRTNRLFICAAHQACAEVVGTAQYELGLMIADVFLAESQPLAILRRSDATTPRSIALHPATRSYFDLSGFEEVIEVASTVAAAEGLAEGRWDAALTAARFAGPHELVSEIDPPRDAWLVIGGPERTKVQKL